MTKVLLINPPKKIYDRAVGFSTYIPLGLLSVASMIKDICEVQILDCLVTDFEIQEYEGYTVYGTPYDKIKDRIRSFNPDIVGVSSLFSYQSENAMNVAKICKEINPNILVVFGGPDATVRYEHFLKNCPVDYCVVREGEKAFREFILKFNAKEPLTDIEGMAYLERGIAKLKPRKFTVNLDAYPIPAYELVDMEVYMKNKYFYCARGAMKRSINIITSRGCPFSCVFCSVHLHMGKQFRSNSPEYVLNHLKLLIEKYNITNFHFEDDNISLDKARFEKILDIIIENKLNIKWDTPNGIRADTLNYEFLKKIKKSGCTKLKIAIEAGNQEVLDKIVKKSTSLSYMIEIAKYCHELKINVSAFYIIGFPGETIANMQETIDLAIRLLQDYGVVPSLHVALPLYGTELYETVKEKGYFTKEMTDHDLAIGAKPMGEHLITTPEFSPKDIDVLIKDYRYRKKMWLIKHALNHPIFSIKRAWNRPILMKYLNFWEKDIQPMSISNDPITTKVTI